MWTNLPRGVARCQHIKVNGTRCDSPSLNGKAFCYFHYRSRLHDPAVSSRANSQEPRALSQEPKAKSEELQPAGVPLNAEFFLLEDAPSSQCALQWVLRRILAASIDRRQAALLLYGLQIAAANVKQTTFEPYYRKVIRNLPAAEPAEIAHQPAQNCLECHPEPGAFEQSESRVKDLGEPPVPRAAEAAKELGVEASILISHSPAETRKPPADSPAAPPDSPELPTDHCPLTTVPTPPRNKTSRRPRTASVALDRRMLASTPRAALSLMFQREVRRHLARLDFPNSPEPET